MPDWGTWCWQARTQARLTQAEAAQIAGVSVRTWNRWENFVAEPDVWRRESVRDALAVELVARADERAALRIARGGR